MLCLILMYALVRIWPLSEAEVKLLSICYRFKVKYRGKYTFFLFQKILWTVCQRPIHMEHM